LANSSVSTSKTVVKTVIAGEDLAKGDAVYISGGTGDNPEVSKADADDSAKMPVFGVTSEAVTATNTTDLVIYGLLTSYDTTGFTTGDSLFVSTTPGQLTTTKPSGESALLQTVGKVIKGNSSGGKITITGAGRTNATPNLDEGNIFIGDTNNLSVTNTMNAAFYSHVVLGSNNLLLGDGSSAPTETAAETVIEDNIHNASVRLQQFRETVETTANVSGAVTFNVANGSIFKANVVGDITSLALTGVQAGTSATLILTQGTTTGTLTAGASWLWAGGEKTLSTNTGDVDVISVVNDGTNYLASLTKGYVT